MAHVAYQPCAGTREVPWDARTIAIVASDIRGVPLADPLLLQLLEKSECLLPGTPTPLASGEQGAQCLSDQLAAGPSLSLGSPVDLLQEFLGKRS